MATYFYLEKSTDVDVTPYNWLPVVAFSAMIFIIAFGALPIPYVILSEILPNGVGSMQLSSPSFLVNQINAFLSLSFPSLSIVSVDSEHRNHTGFVHFMGSHLCRY